MHCAGVGGGGSKDKKIRARSLERVPDRGHHRDIGIVRVCSRRLRIVAVADLTTELEVADVTAGSSWKCATMAGASTPRSRPTLPRWAWERVRHLQGKTFVTPTLAGELVQDPQGAPGGSNDPMAMLTPRQREILQLHTTAELVQFAIKHGIVAV